MCKYHAMAQYSLFNVWAVLLPLKLLLMGGYHLTDFDVHRNWMAITKNLPIAKWYFEDTNQWTLDYPPFFAYFEWVLAQLVPTVVKNDGALDIVATGNYGWPTVVFQRLTVIASEIFLFYALQTYINTLKTAAGKRRAYVVACLLALLPALLICDHIHFQYNGMLFGILTMCLARARSHRYVLLAFWFATLLCFKHIYLYLAPSIFVWLLFQCIGFTPMKFDWHLLTKIGLTVIAVFAVAFAPFARHLPQLLTRLFPFSRGLTHAYWAPNMWALYSFADRVLIQMYRHLPGVRLALDRYLGADITTKLLAGLELLALATRGLVGDVAFAILPTVTPAVTFGLTLFYMILALIPLAMNPTYPRFVGAMTLCGYALFLFGWHVHEKAVLVVVWPFTFIAARDRLLLKPFTLLVSAGFVLLFPLIFTPMEWGVKVGYTVVWLMVFFVNFSKVTPVPRLTTPKSTGGVILDRVVQWYVLGLVPLVVVVTVLEVLETKYAVLQRLEFAKLMLTLVYCAVGVVGLWIGFNALYFGRDDLWNDDDDA